MSGYQTFELRVPEGVSAVLTGTGLEAYDVDGGTVRVGRKVVSPSGAGWLIRKMRHMPPEGSPDGYAAVKLFPDTDFQTIAAWCGGYVGDDGDEEHVPCIGVPQAGGTVALARMHDWIAVDAAGAAVVWREPPRRPAGPKPLIGPGSPDGGK
jgi:hypothetical protein